MSSFLALNNDEGSLLVFRFSTFTKTHSRVGSMSWVSESLRYPWNFLLANLALRFIIVELVGFLIEVVYIDIDAPYIPLFLLFFVWLVYTSSWFSIKLGHLTTSLYFFVIYFNTFLTLQAKFDSLTDVYILRE